MRFRLWIAVVSVLVALPAVATAQYRPTELPRRPGGYGRSSVRPGAYPGQYDSSRFPHSSGRSPYGEPVSGPYADDSYVIESQPVYRYYKYCTGCGETVPDSASVGERCPHCGITWVMDSTNPSATLQGGARRAAPAKILSSHQVMQILKLVGVIGALVIAGLVYLMRRAKYSPTQVLAAGRSMVYSPWERAQANVAGTESCSSSGGVTDAPGGRSADGASPPDTGASQTSEHSVLALRRKFRPRS